MIFFSKILCVGIRISLTAIFFLFISLTVHSQVYVTGNEAASFYEDVTDEFRRQIEMAIPEKAIAIQTKPRKLLVINRHVHNGKVVSGHGSIKYANYAIKLIGERTGAFQAYFSKDTLVFQSEVLNQFDAICFNNTGGVLFEDKELRRNLLEYVFSGKGFIGIHAAGATFVQYPVYDQFPEFGIMMGGYENGGHPWMDHEWINIKVEEPTHPLNRIFPYENFDISDEVFQFSEPYTRDNLRILLKIDTSRTDTGPNRRILPERRKDMDLAMSWVRRYGRGRVFYSSFGDNPHVFWDTRILHHNMAGIQYALGDLPAPATPNNKLTPAIEAREKLDWKFGISAYTFKDNTLFETIEQTASLGLLYMGGFSAQKVSVEINKNFDHNLSDGEIFTIQQKFISSGITMINYYIHDIPADAAICEKIFSFASRMGVETIVSEPKPEALDIIEKYCVKYDIRLAIHNHTKDISPVYWDPKNVAKACEGRNSLIGACADLGYWIRAGIDITEAINILKDRLITFHVHDLDKLSKKGHDVPWGTGECNLEQFFTRLSQEGGKPVFIGLEYAYNWGSSLPEVKQSIEFLDALSIKLSQ
jgi:type 1 glutamine amidotransferase/sugar phosphate isomerase/epimerase